MSFPAKPTLQEAAARNQAVNPDRVRQIQDVLKRLQDRGLVQPSKYGLQPGLASAPLGAASAHGIRMMNRLSSIDR